MLPAENNILKKISRDGNWPRDFSHRHDIPGQYINYLIDSLIHRGIVRRSWAGGYRLTSKGKKLAVSS